MNRVNEVTKDAFNALIQLRNLPKDASVRPEHLYQRLRGYVDEVIARGKQTGMTETDISDVVYALVALGDEIAQRKPGAVRAHWHQRPLQLHYFAENVAGDGFFERLERIVRDPRRIEALVVYHLCLELGFLGRFAVRGGESELEVVKRRVREGLGPLLRPEAVSRRHLPKKERLHSRSMDFIALWLGLFALLFALCFIVALRIALDRMRDDLTDRSTEVLESFAKSDQAERG
ncbi:MAG: DotU family type IV/VI secretion system protein [Deltaproteobacteria bacterium]|jgi:type VI secretion system protein ImpK|nr:DotU family type IV/VI secretion system protein [Deltaproteobacteria bacterium]MBK8236765.1 DotU family type IV/VI secretion system protein [Deltaproteobacteria bacterium]MBK8720059.1 DotU family type IV/VI secretion system protein [Deltaproteobacteria bacterium]MBP7289388.1 DotU family type IV/VI secretion system protein [Nannocystaceae bacterium]